MSAASLEQACEEILEATGRVVGIEQGVVYQPDESGERLVVKGMLVPEALPASVEAGNPDSLAAQAFGRREAQKRDEEAALPLLYREEVLGVLWVRGVRPAGVSREEGFESLRRLAGESALVLHAARMAEELEQGDLEVEALLDLDAEKG